MPPKKAGGKGKGAKGKGGAATGGGGGAIGRVVVMLLYLAVILVILYCGRLVYIKAKSYFRRGRSMGKTIAGCQIECTETITEDCRFSEKVIPEAEIRRGPRSSGMWDVPLHTFATMSFKQLNEVDFMHQAEKIAFVMGHIWVPATRNEQPCIMIYTLEGEYKKNILLHNMNFAPNAIAEWSPAALDYHISSLAVMGGYSGIHVLSLDTFAIRQLTEGRFSDVCVADDEIFALEYEIQTVYVFEHDDQMFRLTDTLTFDVAKRDHYFHSWNTLFFFNNQLHVIDSLEDSVLQFKIGDHKLSLRAQYGKRGSEAAGDLRRPRLCGYDNYGTLLVCDNINSRLQILSSGGEWTITSGMDQLNFSPFHVLQVNDTFMWVQDWLHGNMFLYKFY